MRSFRDDMNGPGFVQGLIDRALDAAFPARCAGCDADGPPLCDRCLPALDARLTADAGVPIGLPGEIPEPLLQLEWCTAFRGVARDALHRLKYQGEQRLAEPMGAAIARRWSRVGIGAEVMTHVPVHASRRRRRGYDQAERIGRAAAAHLGMPFDSLLERRRETIAQFDLDRADRATNVAGAFRIRPTIMSVPGAYERMVRGRWVLLIDDVTTTGATLAECAVALEAAGAAAVSAITLARER
jgi:ComF family protein